MDGGRHASFKAPFDIRRHVTSANGTSLPCNNCAQRDSDIQTLQLIIKKEKAEKAALSKWKCIVDCWRAFADLKTAPPRLAANVYVRRWNAPDPKTSGNAFFSDCPKCLYVCLLLFFWQLVYTVPRCYRHPWSETGRLCRFKIRGTFPLTPQYLVLP